MPHNGNDFLRDVKQRTKIQRQKANFAVRKTATLFSRPQKNLEIDWVMMMPLLCQEEGSRPHSSRTSLPLTYKTFFIFSLLLLSSSRVSAKELPEKSQNADNIILPVLRLTEDALAGNVFAQLEMAELFLRGNSELRIEKNIRHAINWYEKAALAGDIAAQYMMGMYHLGKLDGKNAVVEMEEPNQSEADRWFGMIIQQANHCKKSKTCSHYSIESALKYITSAYQFISKHSEADFRNAAFWHEQHANAGDIYSACALALQYQLGKGVEKDEHMAAEWYLKAIKIGESCIDKQSCGLRTHHEVAAALIQGYIHLRHLNYHFDYQTAVRWAEAAASPGVDFSYAQNFLGVMYFEGLGVKKDIEKAITWFQKSIENKHPLAQVNLDIAFKAKAIMQTSGSQKTIAYVDIRPEHMKEEGRRLFEMGQAYELADDIAKAIALYQQSAQLGHPVAVTTLNYLFTEESVKFQFEGMITPWMASKDDYENDRTYFYTESGYARLLQSININNPAEVGVARVQPDLGNAYNEGSIVPNENAADQDSIHLQVRLAFLVLNGEANTISYEQALEILLTASVTELSNSPDNEPLLVISKEYLHRMIDEATDFQNGKFFEKTPSWIMHVIRDIRNQEISDGFTQQNHHDLPLAFLLRLIQIELDKAYEFSQQGKPWQEMIAILRAANLGHGTSQYLMGKAYVRGAYVERNLTKAVDWWEIAARHKNVKAQFYLGKMYVEGKYVKPNIAKGLELLKAAAEKPEMRAGRYAQEFLNDYFKDHPSESTLPYGIGAAATLLGGGVWGLYSLYKKKQAEQKAREEAEQELKTRREGALIANLNQLTKEIIPAHWVIQDGNAKLELKMHDAFTWNLTELTLPLHSSLVYPDKKLTGDAFYQFLDLNLFKKLATAGLVVSRTADQLTLTLPASSELKIDYRKMNANLLNLLSAAIEATQPFIDYLNAVKLMIQRKIEERLDQYKVEYHNAKEKYEAVLLNAQQSVAEGGHVAKKGKELESSCKSFKDISSVEVWNEKFKQMSSADIAALETFYVKLGYQMTLIKDRCAGWSDLENSIQNLRSVVTRKDKGKAKAIVNVPDTKPEKTDELVINELPHPEPVAVHSEMEPLVITSSSSSPDKVSPRHYTDFTMQPLFKYRKPVLVQEGSSPSSAPVVSAEADALWTRAANLTTFMCDAAVILSKPDQNDFNKAMALRVMVDVIPMLFEACRRCVSEPVLKVRIPLDELRPIRHAIRHLVHAFLYANEGDDSRNRLIEFCNDPRGFLLNRKHFSGSLLRLSTLCRGLLHSQEILELSDAMKKQAMIQEFHFISQAVKQLNQQLHDAITSANLYHAVCGSLVAIGEYQWFPSHQQRLAGLLHLNSTEREKALKAMSMEDVISLCREIRNCRGHEIDAEITTLIVQNRETSLDDLSDEFKRHLAFSISDRYQEFKHQLSQADEDLEERRATNSFRR